MADGSRSVLSRPVGKSRSLWRSGRVWLGLLLSLACVILALQGIDPVEVIATLGGTRLGWLALSVLLVFLSVAAKAVRWQVLLKTGPEQRLALGQPPRRPGGPAAVDQNRSSRGLVPAPRIGLGRLFSIWLAGAALNLALPAPRSGDLARAYLAGEAGSTSKSLVLGTIAAEKMLDMIMLAVSFLGLVPFMALPAELAARQAPVIGLALVLLLSVAIVLSQRHRLLALARWLLLRLPTRWSGSLLGSTERAVQGLDALRYPRLVLLLAWWSVVVWVLAAAVNYVIFLALGLPPSWIQSVFVLVVLQAGVAVPSSPGKVGVFQVLCRWALGVFGVAAANGLAYGILLYVAAVVSQMVVGALALLWESWQMRQSPVVLSSLLAQGEDTLQSPV